MIQQRTSTTDLARMEREALSITAQDALERSLERAGWLIHRCEISVPNRTIKMEFSRLLESGGSLQVVFWAFDHGAFLERHTITSGLECVGPKHDRSISRPLVVEFVGRKKSSGYRSGLRDLALYLADNAPRQGTDFFPVVRHIAGLLNSAEAAQ